MSKKKISLILIAAFVVLVTSASVISYSIATKQSKALNQLSADAEGNGTDVAGNLDLDYITNIDLIIQNSYKDDESSSYNIVEIIPETDDGNDSGLDDYIKDGYFKDCVIDANRTIVDLMKSGKIDYKKIVVNSSVTLTSASDYDGLKVQDVLNSADLIYLSSARGDSYSSQCNMSEEVYNWLHTYTLEMGNKRPIIISKLGQVVSSDDKVKTYQTFVNDIKKYYVRYRSFAWDTPKLTPKEFFGASGKSNYITFDVGQKKATGNILIINSSGTDDHTGFSKILKDYELSELHATEEEEEDDDSGAPEEATTEAASTEEGSTEEGTTEATTEEATTEAPSNNTSGVNPLIRDAYYGDYAKRPALITYKYVTPEQLQADPTLLYEADGKTSKYDFVYIEDTVKTSAIDDSVYAALKNYAKASNYLIYRQDWLVDGDTTITVDTNSYFHQLYNLLVRSNNEGKYKNVLTVPYSFFEKLGNDVEGAKPVAELINNAVYRGHGGDSDQDNTKYRILEIQPCYPIDLKLAESRSGGKNGIKGSYYSVLDNVAYGMSEDEVGPDEDYYAFELSKAKIAHALGIKVNQIEIDAVSVDELISTKKSISDYYDMVYVGGDTSALSPINKVSAQIDGNKNSATLISNYKEELTYFDMYTHTGLPYTVPLISGRPGLATSGAQYVAGTIGTESNTVVELNGNDLNKIKLDELKEYLNQDLPLIVEKTVADAFEESYQYDPNNEKAKNQSRMNQLKLSHIDPDSNMYKFLEFAYLKNAENTSSEKPEADRIHNICWGSFEIGENSVKKEENSDGKYGTTDSGFVTVYVTNLENELRTVSAYSKRPRIKLNASPAKYTENDSSCINFGSTVEFNVSIMNVNPDSDGYIVEAYMDSDANGLFTESEKQSDVSYSVDDENKDISFELDSDFIGPVNWKIVVRDKTTGLVGFISNVSYFRPESDTKKTIRILQIMPVHSDKIAKYQSGKNVSFEGIQTDGHSLYFCTECQQAQYPISYNITTGISNGDFGLNSYMNSKTTFDGKVNLGLHEHDFGIVKYEDAAGGKSACDVWESNFVDTLTHGSDGTLESGEYEFDLDIITYDKFDEIWKEAKNRSDSDAETNADLAQKGLTNYETMLEELDTPGTNIYNCRVALEEAMHEAARDYNSSFRADEISNGNYQTWRTNIVNGVGITKDEKDNWIDGPWIKDRQYYKFWEYFNSNNGSYNSNFDKLAEKYNAYIEEYDKIVQAKKDYKADLRNSATLDNNWLNNYDMVVLGFAEDFGGVDLSKESCKQIKAYIEDGQGSVLNTHDTMTRFKDKGSLNLTSTLRQSFGQDRFHAVEPSNDEEEAEPESFDATFTVDLESKTLHPTKMFLKLNDSNPMPEDGQDPITLGNKDLNIVIQKAQYWGASIVSVTEGDEHTSVDDKVSVNVEVLDSQGNPVNNETVTCVSTNSGYYNGVIASQNAKTDASGKVVIQMEQNADVQVVTSPKSAAIHLKEKDATCTLTASATSCVANATMTGDAKSASDDLNVTVTVYNADGSVVSKGSKVTMQTKYGALTEQTDVNGTVDFTITRPTAASGALYETPTGSQYRKFPTENASTYFWTERFVKEEQSSYRNRLGYNSPIGATDYFIMSKSLDAGCLISPYRYANLMGNDAIGGQPNASKSYDAKYGTRRASQVNKGCVTMYPFNISSDLMISGTHSQFYALDMEDPNVNVWYTLAGTHVREDGDYAVGFEMSSFYAASPHDGMESYYLYSKQNVYYCGAGHATVTAYDRSNNDERRLFINIIVNSVSRGKTKMNLKLYNKCDKKENCDDNYVDKDPKNNAKLSKDKDTLFFNDSIGMYQYNVDDDTACPEFDFKVITGTEPISKIEVFYDLNYGDGGELNKSNNYDETDPAHEKNHIMIASYDGSKADQRIRLRKDKEGEDPVFPKLPLKPSYFDNYQDYTYIVIKAQDESGSTKVARVKINLIRKLFDLTDATITNDKQFITTYKFVVDVTDKEKFNI